MIKLQDGTYNEEILMAMLQGEGYAVLFMANRINKEKAQVLIAIGKDREDAFYQYDLLMSEEPTISGDGSLTPMLHAKKFLLNECEEWARTIGINTLHIVGFDDRRAHAYRRLLRHGYNTCGQDLSKTISNR